MTNRSRNRLPAVLVALACAACVGVFLVWVARTPLRARVAVRLPVVRATPVRAASAVENPGTLVAGAGRPSDLPGDWPQFRGPGRDNVATSERPLASGFGSDGPPVLWRIPVGEGHAGAAIRRGCVYLVDYDRDRQEDAIRCLSLADGSEIWRYTYSVVVKRNHGMSRTVPAVSGRYVLTMGPKCHVVCLDANTGEMAWKKDLVAEHGVEVPLWYAGQCPLVDGDRAILVPGARPLMMALDLATGKTIWETKGHEGAGMTHSSIMAMDIGGVRQYVYCANDGVYGVSAEDGRILWHYPDWKIKIANIPSPVFVAPDRIFFCGGYAKGSQMVRLRREGDGFAVELLYALKPTVFGSDQQTPILHKDRIYGVEPEQAELACLDLEGRRLWTSGPGARFGIGPYLIVNDSIFALADETGTLVVADATPEGYRERARAKLLNGHDAWAPMAFAEGRLILRDLTEMICVDVGELTR